MEITWRETPRSHDNDGYNEDRRIYKDDICTSELSCFSVCAFFIGFPRLSSNSSHLWPWICLSCVPKRFTVVRPSFNQKSGTSVVSCSTYQIYNLALAISFIVEYCHVGFSLVFSVWYLGPSCVLRQRNPRRYRTILHTAVWIIRCADTPQHLCCGHTFGFSSALSKHDPTSHLPNHHLQTRRPEKPWEVVGCYQ